MKYIFIAVVLLSFPMKVGSAVPPAVSRQLDCVYPNQAKVRMLLYDRAIPNPDFWVKVAIRESGHNHDQGDAKRTYNVFGMRHPSRRATTSVGSLRNHAVFKSLEDAVADLDLWMQVNPPRKGESMPDYLRRRRYNPDMDAYIKYLSYIRISCA